MQIEKPPLGVIPKDIWEYKRICELVRAIREYTEFGDLETAVKWVNELKNMLEDGKGK